MLFCEETELNNSNTAFAFLFPIWDRFHQWSVSIHKHIFVHTYTLEYLLICTPIGVDKKTYLSIHSLECLFTGRISRPLEKAYIHFKKLSRRYANFHSQLTSPCQLSINLFTTFSRLGRGQCCVTVVLVCSSQMRIDTESFFTYFLAI